MDPPPLAEALILLSGGLDSAACLNFFLELGRPTEALFIDYHQPAAKQEIIAAKAIAQHYDIPLTTIFINGCKHKTLGEIVGRNAFLLTTALMELPKEISTVAIGIHTGTEYPDCSPEFIEKMQNIFNLCSSRNVNIAAPFLDWSKFDIWAYSQLKNIPIEITYSCEAGLIAPCGKCLSCEDRKRLEAYA